jgi:hypothetical protein
MRFKRAIMAFVIAVVAFGFLYYLYNQTKGVDTSQFKPTDTITTTKEPSQTTEAKAPKEVKSQSFDEVGDYYTIKAQYPDTENDAVNEVLHAFVADQVAQFKSDTGVATMTPAEATNIGLIGGRKYLLSIEYSATIADALYGYNFLVVEDTGGAHPNHFNRTFTFASDGTELALADLFKADSGYLQTLSDYTIFTFKLNSSDNGIWEDGATPKAENFSRFVVTDTGITLIFDPYQIAAYAAGTQKVTVPYSILNPFLKDEYKK